ncbi:hypothetical protein ABN028_20315 [Actinopolymorpha sp. B17G11]|uniref:hypothetical protein n=1 Tax=Actinopolymorpha sp. B17G11 TaxID=3160861 RepID=UPI0032E3884F
MQLRQWVTPEAVTGAIDDDMARAWLSAVHASLRSLGGAIAGPVRPPGPGWNYYRVRVEPKGQVVRILLNAAVGLVAASSDDGVPENGPLEFGEVPAPGSYRQAGLAVADADVLRAPLRPEHVERLSDLQRADVRYHQPESVGDLLFNWFD